MLSVPIDPATVSGSSYNIRVVNMSLGMAAVDSYRFDPVCLAVRGLVDQGVVVFAAAWHAHYGGIYYYIGSYCGVLVSC